MPIEYGAEQIFETTKAGVMLKRLITLAIIAASLALPAVALAAGTDTAPAGHVIAGGTDPGGDVNTHWGWDPTHS
ncbi:hypothetical protein ACQP2T_52810 [Nonomuraea sp. CA-143628]|uniref:hypothetical protein n=1 Tax=Nonomuraea sp. CA-143628 TaxID=3239997 RepID=UPI003D8E3D24